MTNYITIHHKKGNLHHNCKFNVSEKIADSILAGLKKYFEIELAKGSITRKNKRVIVEIQVSEPNAEIIRRAFLTQLPIFENLN